MPAYNYYPYYQPYPTYPQIPQAVPPTVPQQISLPQQPFQSAQAGMIWVSGEREAQMYPVAPNNAVTLWSQTEPVVYLKQADATGKPTLKVYDLVERAQATDGQDKPSDDYAKKSDLAAVAGVVKGFDEVIGSIRADIDTMKGDMYGIAGKKKPARKQEVEDDE